MKGMVFTEADEEPNCITSRCHNTTVYRSVKARVEAPARRSL